MIVYYSSLFLALIFLQIEKNSSKKLNTNICYFFVVSILVLIAGLRFQVGTDYPHYVNNYLYVYTKDDYSFFSQPAIFIISKISQFIYDDYATWFLLMSCITVIPTILLIIIRNEYVEWCIIFYILLGCWHFSFNLVKQSVAATILFCGYNYLKNRKFKQWILICVLAFTFHVSAILMVPVYFIIDKQIKIRKIILILIIGIIVFFSYDYLFDLINFLKQDRSLVYGYYKTSSVNVLRVLVGWIPILLCLLWNEGKRYNGDLDFSCLFYLSLLNAVLNTAAMNSLYLYRFCCYTNMYNILFIPKVINGTKRYRKIIMALMFIFYFAFWSYDLYKGSTTVNYHFIFER